MAAHHNSFNKAPEGTWIFHTRKHHPTAIANPYSKDLAKVATSFFITNFPTYVDAKRLWIACESFGKIADAFIARKLSKRGKRFGFLRFLGVTNEEDLARKLSIIWIENFHLFAAIAMFPRPLHQPSSNKKPYNPPTSVPVRHPSKKADSKPFQPSGSRSYAYVVHGFNFNSDSKTAGTQSLTLSDQDLIQVDNTSMVLLVKVHEVGTMNSVYRISNSEGFSNLKILHIGGLWLWIQFPNVDSCVAFKANATMQNLFSSIRNVTPNFVVDERLIWIEINGLPLCAWGSPTFKKVASLFGKFMFFEIDNKHQSMSTGRVCILTKRKKFISESIKAMIHGVSHEEEQEDGELDKVNLVLSDDEEKNFNDIENENHEPDIHVSQPNDIANEMPYVDPKKDEVILQDSPKVDTDHNVHNSPSHDNEIPILDPNSPQTPNNSSDISCPPGFEHLKHQQPEANLKPQTPKNSKCSNSLHYYTSPKLIKGFSLIHELTKVIEVGEALGYDVKGCQQTLEKLIQESKMTRLELFRLKTMWGNYTFDYACSMARGRSGGLISIWDPLTFVKCNFWCDDNFIIVQGSWSNSADIYYIINVYGPQDSTAKENLWQRLSSFILSHAGKYIVCGDFNEVRFDTERFGSVFSQRDAQVFNSFIDSSSLLEIPMGGRLYTWMNKTGTKLNYGPIPFKLFHSWMQRKGFDDMIKQANEEYAKLTFHSTSSLQQKLKFMKMKIKEWHNDSKSKDLERSVEIQSLLNAIEVKIDNSTVSEEERNTRLQLMQEQEDLDRYSINFNLPNLFLTTIITPGSLPFAQMLP
ncbi:Endonuclease/exonuclease/phosphatase [Artemisia annua]|uniref:Endonuclease/exonuclease/phosphatase n=1 Tax=Artemisia annua TaxID=35608 RepID=A0A2U1LRL3_ARTAN|nr:Endonuclease/exonuclease/phosphatase [Artemisia annua]